MRNVSKQETFSTEKKEAESQIRDMDFFATVDVLLPPYSLLDIFICAIWRFIEILARCSKVESA